MYLKLLCFPIISLVVVLKDIMYLKLLCFAIISLVVVLKDAVSYNVNNVPQLTNAAVNQRVYLFCLTNIEDYQTIIWYKIKDWYSVAISPSTRYTWLENNQVMIINYFKTEDAGEYFCGVIARDKVYTKSETYSSVVLKNDNNGRCDQYKNGSFYQPQEIRCVRFNNTVMGQEMDFYNCRQRQSTDCLFYEPQKLICMKYYYAGRQYYVYHCSWEHQHYFQCKNPHFIAIGECTPCLTKDICVSTTFSPQQCISLEFRWSCWQGFSEKSYYNIWHELKIINRNRPVLENIRHLRDVISKTLRDHCNKLDCLYEPTGGTMNTTIDPWIVLDSTSVFFDLPKKSCTNIYHLRFKIAQNLNVDKKWTAIFYTRSSINVLSHIFLTRAQEDYTIFFVFDLNGNRYIDDNLCPDPTNATTLYTDTASSPTTATKLYTYTASLPTTATKLYTDTASSPTTGIQINPRQDHSNGLNTVQISALSITATFVLVVFFCLLFRRYRLHRTLTTRTNLRININASNTFTNTALAGLEGDIAFISFGEAIKYTVPPPYSEIDQNKEMSPPSYDQIANASN